MKKTTILLVALWVALGGCSSSGGGDGGDGGSDGGSDGGDQPPKTYVDDIENRDCETTAGWIVVDPSGAPTDGTRLAVTTDGAHVKAGAGALEFAYPRPAGRFPGLFATVLLTEFESISLWVQAERDAELLLAVSDRDGARFQYRAALAAGGWQQLLLVPADFQPAPDSPVQKAELEPARLGMGMVLVDLKREVPEDSNRLWLDELEVVRKPLLLLDNLQVTSGTLSVGESALIQGEARVSGPGTELQVQAPRLQLRGGVRAENGGRFALQGAVLDSEQQYVTQYQLDTSSGGRLELGDVALYTGFPQFLRARGNCELVLDGFSTYLAATHIETEPGARVSITGSRNIGELTLLPGADVDVTDSDYLLVWLFTPNGTSGVFELPDGTALGDFTLASPFDMTIRSSRNLLWGLVSYPGSDVTFVDSRLLVAGLLFLGSGQQSLSGFRNGGPVPDLGVLGDRTLALVNSSVDIWNFYPAENSQLQASDCLFGELLAFGGAVATVENSSCDGSGGYIGTENDARLEIRSSELTTDITTFDDSSLLLENCTVRGVIRATGNSTVTLRNTTVDGELLEFDQGRIVVE